MTSGSEGPRWVEASTAVTSFDPASGAIKTWDVFPGRSTFEPDDEHVEALIAAMNGAGAEDWNRWRSEHQGVTPNLSGVTFSAWATPNGPTGVNLEGFDLSNCAMNGCSLPFATLRETNLSGARLRECLINQSSIHECDLSGADLTQTSLTGVQSRRSSFRAADLSRATLHASVVADCDFTKADLEAAEFDGGTITGSSFVDASMRSARFGASKIIDCDLVGADLSGAHFVHSDLSGSDLSRARVYAMNCWDTVVPARDRQRDLRVQLRDDPLVTVDDLRMAQFVHLLLNDEGLSTVISTMGEQAVLLLGRFGGGGIETLRAVGDELRAAGYLPMIFEFDRPAGRSYSDVIRALASLARFVVVDLSGPSVPHELAANVPDLKIPFVPILEGTRSSYSMFRDLFEYDWVLRPIVEFGSTSELLELVPSRIITPAEERIADRRRRLDEIFR